MKKNPKKKILFFARAQDYTVTRDADVEQPLADGNFMCGGGRPVSVPGRAEAVAIPPCFLFLFPPHSFLNVKGQGGASRCEDERAIEQL